MDRKGVWCLISTLSIPCRKIRKVKTCFVGGVEFSLTTCATAASIKPQLLGTPICQLEPPVAVWTSTPEPQVLQACSRGATSISDACQLGCFRRVMGQPFGRQPLLSVQESVYLPKQHATYGCM